MVRAVMRDLSWAGAESLWAGKELEVWCNPQWPAMLLDTTLAHVLQVLHPDSRFWGRAFCFLEGLGRQVLPPYSSLAMLYHFVLHSASF